MYGPYRREYRYDPNRHMMVLLPDVRNVIPPLASGLAPVNGAARVNGDIPTHTIEGRVLFNELPPGSVLPVPANIGLPMVNAFTPLFPLNAPNDPLNRFPRPGPSWYDRQSILQKYIDVQAENMHSQGPEVRGSRRPQTVFEEETADKLSSMFESKSQSTLTLLDESILRHQKELAVIR